LAASYDWSTRRGCVVHFGGSAFCLAVGALVVLDRGQISDMMAEVGEIFGLLFGIGIWMVGPVTGPMAMILSGVITVFAFRRRRVSRRSGELS